MQRKLTEQGLKYLEAGQFKKAGQILSLLVKSFPENSEAHHMLGIIELENGNLATAETLVKAAVRLDPKNPIFYNTLGSIQVRGHKFEQAEAAFLTAAQISPDKIEYKYNLAHFYLTQNQYKKAIDFYYYILQANPTHYLSIRGLTVCYMFCGEPEIALEHAMEWIQEFSIYDEPYYYLGLCYYATNKITEALKAYDRGLALNPNNHEILTAIGACYKSLANTSIAETYLLKSINIDTNNPVALYNLGCIKLEQGKLDAAKKNFMNANSLDKSYADPICELGRIELIKGDIVKALNLFNQAQQNEPHNTKPGLLIATTLLRQKLFIDGWVTYRNIFSIPNMLTHIASWDGEVVNDQQTLLIWAPKEYSDYAQQIMFASILPELKNKAKNVVIICDKMLVKRFSKSFPEYYFSSKLNVFDLPSQYQSIAYQIPLNSLGQIFRNAIENFSINSPYIKYDLARKNQYREKYQQLFNNKKLIGIACRATDYNNITDPIRSINATELLPLLNKNNCQFINLQPNYQRFDSEQIYIDLEADSTELAEQMASLDLIISVDNGIAHLAGAMGLKTYTLIPAHAQWYWFEDTQTSLWYPNMQLFKQNDLHNWRPVLKQLYKEI